MSEYFLLELFGSCFNIIYSLLLMREKIAGWAFGIASSIIGIVLFYETKLYAQSIISIYYLGVGIYGWIYWRKAKLRNEHIHIWTLRTQLIFAAAATAGSIGFYYIMKTYTDASSPLVDSFVTVFGFLASIKEARKILTSWVYWFFINILSGYLYFTQGLTFYFVLMLVYAAICIPGYLNWLAIYRKNPEPSLH